jgi:hypothetical protein
MASRFIGRVSINIAYTDNTKDSFAVLVDEFGNISSDREDLAPAAAVMQAIISEANSGMSARSITDKPANSIFVHLHGRVANDVTGTFEDVNIIGDLLDPSQKLSDGAGDELTIANLQTLLTPVTKTVELIPDDLAASLNAYWTIEEGTSGTVYDLINNKPLLLDGSSVTETPTIQGAIAIESGVQTLSSNGGYVASPRSVTCWIDVIALKSTGSHLFFRMGSIAILISLGSNGRITGQSISGTIEHATICSESQRYFVGVGASGTIVDVNVNDSMETDDPFIGGSNNGSDVLINTQSVDGRISIGEIALWEKRLTEADYLALYNNGEGLSLV